ncbi:hypothetical protein LO762_01930 [Actinocorallia sp. API 0066]|uniref:hypothetical protein n=1 Tax=Actinocorallia sp. API 0066 TaxID=2896846 RepID=UPI001E5F6F24|nr:hypothetical protein [Actinocorallia sp. API 0066]MCD0447959.1 hypothetical protein [Actinocorallia sp. API 0066]
MSPLASLVPGVLNLLVAVVWLVDARAVYSLVFDFAPRRIGSGLVTVIGGGTLLLFGVLLVAASVPPSRWRAGVRAARPPLPGVPPIPFGGGAGAVPPPHVPGPAQPFAPGGEAPHAPSYGPAQGGPYGAGVPPEGPAPEGSRWMEPGKGER